LCDVDTHRGRMAAIEARYGTAEALLRRALAMATALNDPLRVAALHGVIANCEESRGDHDAAERDVRVAAAHPARRSMSSAYLAWILRARARWDEIEEIANSSELWASPEEIVWQPLALIASGEGRLARGDLAGASERYGTALTMARETHDPDWTVLAL